MCGIAGRIGSEPLRQVELRGCLEVMNAEQGRRGPDGSGIFVSPDGKVGFAHTRLAILDLSEAGAQPMTSGDGLVRITFNGEIYNFRELKADLEREGVAFRSRTDTEAIIELYSRHGTAAFSMLRGMFSFGLFDERTREIFLVRDRYGIKPLYYWAGDGEILFASTVRALIRSGRISAAPDPLAPVAFLLTGSVPCPRTTIRGILSVPPGHYARVSDGRVTLQGYYDLDFTPRRAAGSAEAAASVRSLLADAVSSHLISDAPLGVFLSGGIDSSLLTALAATAREIPVITLSVNHMEREFDEEPYQRLITGRYRTDHRKVLLGDGDVLDMLPGFFAAMDQPTIDGLNTYAVSWAATRAGLKAVLSGLGGDELFCGYGSVRRYPWVRRIRRIPAVARAAAALLGRWNRKYLRLAPANGAEHVGDYLTFRGLFGATELWPVFGQAMVGEALGILSAPSGGAARSHAVNEISEMEFRNYLPNQLLKDSDIMSMAHSVEIRVPFLDHPLVDYVAGLPPDVRLRKGVQKGLLAEACRDLLPPEIWAREKQGFTFPFDVWMRGVLGDEIGGVSFSDPGLRAIFAKTWGGFLAGTDHWSRPYALYVFARFFAGA